MAINLPDLPQAVRTYLNTKVITTLEVGQVLPEPLVPGAHFYIRVALKNASAGDGGIALTNLRYQVWVKDPTIVKFYVPQQLDGRSIDIHGQYLVPNTLVEFFQFDPSDLDVSYLQIGENTSYGFRGRIEGGAPGSTTIISARILADPDINALFPRNENSTWGSTNISVVAG